MEGPGEGGEDDPYGMGGAGGGFGGQMKTAAEKREARMRYKLRRATTAPRRDPKLYDYE